MRAPRRPGGPRPLAAILLVLAGLAGFAGSAYAAGPEDLQLSSPAVTSDGMLSVVATVPAVLSGRDLPAATFTAMQGGTTVPVSASRVIDGTAELVLVLDASGDARTVTAEKSAAADLLRDLPSQTPTTVLPGGARTTARSALDAVAQVRPTPGARLLDGLPAAPPVRRFVVVLTGCPALDAENRDIAGQNTQVSVLSLGAGCEAAAAQLTGSDPGVVRTGLDTDDLFAGVDTVSRAVLGEYVLRSAGTVGPGPLQVTVTAGTAVAAATVDLPKLGAAPASGGGGGGGKDDPVWPVVAAAVLAALAAVLLGLELGARRRTAAAG